MCYTIGYTDSIGTWFSAELAPGVKISNAPPSGATSWKQAFFPIGRPVPLKVGDSIKININIQMTDNASTWQWQVTIRRGEGGSGEIYRFEHSTQAGQLDKFFNNRPYEHKLRRDEEGEIDLFILGLMDGSAAIDEIALKTADRFPSRYKSFIMPGDGCMSW